MGHIFISYSHKDTKYAHKLANALTDMGINVWIDERLDYGSQWPHEIQKQLDTCDAFILVMSPRSFASDWVQSELQRAKRKLKPIFPVLLEGDEPWLSVESTQYYDVRNGELPDSRFYSALKRVVSASPNAQTFSRVPKSSKKAEPVKTTQQKDKRMLIFATLGAGGLVTILGICLIAVFLLFQQIGGGNNPLSPASTGLDVTVTMPTLTEEAMFTQGLTSSVTTLPTSTKTPPTFTPVPPTRTATLTFTPRPASGTCRDGYVYRLINSSDKKCVSPASKAQADADNAAAESRQVKASLVNAYGPDACAYGYLWRNLYEGDVVCVSSERYYQYQQENADDVLYKTPGSIYCINGYVWRDAFPFDGDIVCVTPAARDQAQVDNSRSDSYKAVNYYGDNDCIPDYVWREAFAGDYVCVTPAVKQQVQRDNAEAPMHTWP